MGTTRIHSGGALLVSALIVAGIMACAPRNDVPPAPVPVDVTSLAPCFHEDGASPDADGTAQTYPCVWDGATRGDGPGAGQYTGSRWLVYVSGQCPATYVQPSEGIRCLDVREWLDPS